MEPTDTLIVLFTGLLVLFTGLLVLVTFLQYRLASVQQKAIHRPSLFLRSARLVELGEVIEVHFTLANIGGTKATLTGGRLGLQLYPMDRDPPTPDNFGMLFSRMIAPEKITIGPGEHKVIIAKGSVQTHPVWWPEREGKSLYVWGQVIFKDEVNIKRQLGFLRRFDENTRRFAVVRDSDYEYHD